MRGPGRTSCTLVAVLLLAGSLMPVAAIDKSFAQRAYEQMLGAIASGSYEQFTALGDVVFRSLQRDEFDRVVEHFSAHLANGQRSSYLGAFRIHGMTVHYWRLRFSDQPDDWLAKLAVKDEQVRGFFISPP